MRRFTIAILCSAALFATACNQSPENQAPEDLNATGEQAASTAVENASGEEYFRIEALPVAPAKISALSGKFKMLNASAANGIPSDRRGGACLVFGAADLGYPIMAARSCTTNESCETGEIGTDTTAASATYCDGKTHTCWAKPGSNNAASKLCDKGKIFPVDTLNPVPASGPIDVSEWVSPGAKVRMVACIQKTGAKPGPSPTGTGCASKDGPDRIEVMGPVATVKQ